YVKPGELIIAPHDCYGGTYRLLRHKADLGHYRVKFVDQTNLGELAKVIAEEPPQLLLIETPSNPLLRLTDIRAVCELAKPHGTLCVADNTFLSPVLQKPFELGVDVIIHSTTKYLNGHSDVVGGAVVSRTEELHQFFFWWGNCIGNTGSPMDNYFTLRGLRTLEVRLKQQEQTARQVAEFLQSHPAVTQVYYPGLSDHPSHELAKRQQNGFGAMISFELAGGEPEIIQLVNHLQLFSLAESLGGFESLIAHPATMTHSAMDPEARRTAGISDQLFRISIGLETPEDLLADLSKALNVVVENRQATFSTNAVLAKV
ncbi:MAG: PLP-dependent transferase, partial [Vampirovibrio sp.]|nr:PLP-dependent transferase [Vampirovibrio sp.]